MTFSLLSMEGFSFLLRWMHYFFGVIWIGLLYYFNFVQGSYFAETDATTKTNAIQKLVPRALWWFRWGAMWTFVSGLLILMIKFHQGGVELFSTSWGICILTGASMATLMWFNVWFVIWPNQKIVIANASGSPQPTAAQAGARALTASRTNVFLSIGMLFFMGAASHLPIETLPESPFSLAFGIIAALLLAIEANALKGKTGPLTTIKGVITCGFVFTAVLYVLMEVVL